MRIGFIGLGNMGAPMAYNLARAGHTVLGFDTQNLTVEMVEVVQTARDCAQNAEVVITMLPNGKILKSIADKTIQYMKEGSIFLDCSTVDVASAKSVAVIAKTHKVIPLDAPVSGGVSRAKIGELMIMVGGNEDHIESVQELLSVMGKVQYAGPLGSGHAMKALNNYVSAAGLIASFEALAAARSFGIEPDNFLKIINGATGKNNTTEVKLDKFVISEKFNSGFALDLMVKDVSIADSLIKDLSADKPLSENVSNYLSKSLAELGKNSDHTEVYKVLKK